MFGVSESTPLDLKFRLLHAPVRISAWFWLGAIMIGGGNRSPDRALMAVACILVSILVHEFGHGLVARLFGHRFEVTLHALGGVCTYDASHDSTGKRLAVLAAGPGAQLLLLALVCLGGKLLLGISLEDSGGLMLGNLGIGTSRSPVIVDPIPALSPYIQPLFQAYQVLIFINFLWPLLNLLPIWPLDGGQITCELWSHVDPRDGRRRGHIVSLITAGLLMVYTLYASRGDTEQTNLFRVVFFGFFAFLNYQVLQGYHARYRTYGSDDDRDWR